MRLVKTSAVLLLTLFWVFATNHCALEQVAEIGLLACSTHDGSQQDQEKGCEEDGCASVENQLYKAEDAQIPITAPTFLVAVFLSPPQAEVSAALASSIQFLPDTTPPELSRTWQFSYRAALPPRAPSLLS